jgi:peptide/nickel transport system substrate-binding protein
MPVRRKARRLPRSSAALLLGLVVVIIAAGVLGSLSLLTHIGLLGAHSGPTTPIPVRGGTWTDDFYHDLDSLIPNGSFDASAWMVDQALYLPLFYGDAFGVIHPGAASVVPTVQNGGINANATTWTFHLRPHLVWSDGAPYDARDVDFTWKLWLNPKFGATFPYGATGSELIRSADVSADHLTITFHLKQPYVPFLANLWVDGMQAPLPAHQFSKIPPEQILNPKSPYDLDPQVVSGPFMMGESVPADHYTLIRNPRYYRAIEGLPYLDKVVFRIVDAVTILKDLAAGSIDSTWFLNNLQVPVYQRLSHYTLVTPPDSAQFEALWFNFHNTVLASHPEVREAIALAIDHQALIQQVWYGLATPLCTDHGSFYHPGYDPAALVFGCQQPDLELANQLLDENGWVKGKDGVRARDGQLLEFDYSTASTHWREEAEAIIQRDVSSIGIKLDIQNYDSGPFFGSFLPGGKASPPTGAVAGRYDIAEFAQILTYDPDDSSLLSCDQIPPHGYNITFYCNPALDTLYKQELSTADSRVRQQIFQQIHQIYLTEYPFIVLDGIPGLALVRKGTHNYQISAMEGETINIWEWWCDHGKC